MITQAGPHCDVCDSYILFGFVNNFRVNGIEQDLMCDDKCKDKVLEAFKSKDWQSLPNGKLRRAYKEYIDKGGILK